MPWAAYFRCLLTWFRVQNREQFAIRAINQLRPRLVVQEPLAAPAAAAFAFALAASYSDRVSPPALKFAFTLAALAPAVGARDRPRRARRQPRAAPCRAARSAFACAAIAALAHAVADAEDRAVCLWEQRRDRQRAVNEYADDGGASEVRLSEDEDGRGRVYACQAKCESTGQDAGCRAGAACVGTRMCDFGFLYRVAEADDDAL